MYPAYSRVGRGNLVLRHSRSPLSAEFWKHCVLSGGIQHRALPRHQSEEINIYISLPRVGIEPTTSPFYSHTSCPCATTGLTQKFVNYEKLFYNREIYFLKT